MSKKRLVQLLKMGILMSVLGFFAFIPKDENTIDRIVTSMQKWIDANPQEKVYLHTDKPYYALGDTIWFKAYVTVGSRHQLSALSGALYVDLINEKDSIEKSLKLPVTAGMAMGDFSLNEALREGNYRIRAYTQWMRNAGEEYFFDRTFMVGNPFDGLSNGRSGNLSGEPQADNKTKITKNSAAGSRFLKSDVQFFPEGGMLVNGVASRVGFKAVGVDGRSIHVKGLVTDELNEEVADFESEHAGMGTFNLKPREGKSYKAKITYPDGSESTLALPKAQSGGFVLAVYQPNKDSLLVRVNTASAKATEPLNVNLLAQSGGEAIYATAMKITRPINSIWLLKKDFPTGIAQFTLFRDGGEPINERVAFIKNDDQMKLRIETAKNSYKPREQVSINLQAFNSKDKPSAGNFSVSVINEDKVPMDEISQHTIFTDMLLTSDLKGYVEKPNYYFSGQQPDKTKKALDNLMLTQGYRRFTWKEVLRDTVIRPLYTAEKLGTVITGKVMSLSNKPVVKGKVTLMSTKAGIIEGTTTDNAGRFKFDQMVFTDSISFSLQARTQKNRKRVQVILDNLPPQQLGRNKNLADLNTDIAGAAGVYLNNRKKQEDLQVRAGKPDHAQRLKQVTINAKKSAAEDYAPQGALVISNGSADQTFVFDNAEACATLEICLQGKLHGIQFREYKRKYDFVPLYPHIYDAIEKIWVPIQVILNGRRLDISEAGDIFQSSNLNPADIAKIQVVKSNEALKNYLGGASLLITTKKSMRSNNDPSIVNFLPKGFNKAREFYSPRYDRPGLDDQYQDFRSTIYWNPSIKTYDAGKTSFDFFNADGPGNYKVIVEGINAEGELAREVYRYKVEGGDVLVHTPVSQNAKDIVSALQNFHSKLSAEKVYLHTDKPYYNLGDTIWFKAYLFDAAYLAASEKSRFLYVELNDDSAEVVRRISIPIKNGIGWGQIPLPAKIFHEGGYNLRAYTNWMQNFGDDYLFSKRFYLGKPSPDTWLVKSDAKETKVGDKDRVLVNINLTRSDKVAIGLRELDIRVREGDKLLYKQGLRTTNEGNLSLMFDLKEKSDVKNVSVDISSVSPGERQILNIPLNISREQNIDLQFLPEGGTMVAGLKSVIGFKAIAEDGKGINVDGEIYDSKGTLIAPISSLVNGMGSFEFIPLAGEKYTARLNKPEGVNKQYILPSAEPEGIVLSVSNRLESDSLEIDIQATAGAINADSVYYLVGTSRGVVCFAGRVNFKNAKLLIGKGKFASGVARFTLLKGKQPLNERVVFIDHHDQVRINVVSNKPKYLKRDSVALDIEVKDVNGRPLTGNFSLAVTDDSQVRADSLGNQDIGVSLLLNSGLKGAIETPGYYLNKRNSTAWKALDNLMLTQGWTGYKWKDVFDENAVPSFLAEKDFKVTGKVTNIVNKPVKGAQVLISSQKPAFITTTMTDEIGKFTFSDLPQIDSGSFFIQARTPKGKSMNFGAVEVNRQVFPEAHELFRNKIMPWYVNTDTTQLNYVKNKAILLKSEFKPSGIALNEVKIVDKKKIKGTFNKNGPGKADLIFDEKDIKESAVMNLYELLKQKVPGFRVVVEDGIVKMKVNRYDATIGIDGQGLPWFYSDIPSPSIDDVKEDLRDFKIATFRGLEVMYSRQYTAYYGGTSSVGQYVPGANSAAMAGYARNFGMSNGRLPNNSRREFEPAYIEITTFSGAGWHRINKPDVAFYRPLPLMYAQEFYRPKYNLQDGSDLKPDLRATIHWEPNITTDAQGKAKVSFYTSDVTGSYTITIEGSNMDGAIGSGRYKVLVPKPVSK